MTLRIVVRADDPAHAAEILDALGIRTDAPNRPNPEAWTMRTAVSLVVVAAGDRRAGVYFGIDDFDDALDAAAVLARPDAVTVRRDGAAGKIDICDCLSILVERDAPVAEPHDVWDTGMLYTVMPMFEEHAPRIRERLASVGATNPRLVGNRLGRLAGPTRWLLVVDAPESADLAPVERMLLDIRGKWAPVEIKRAISLDTDHLAEIDRRAFDI